MRPFAPAPLAAPLPRRSEAGGGGGLVVLLLAERAPWEGPRPTRAIEDQPGHLLERQTSKLGGTIVLWPRTRKRLAQLFRHKSLDAARFLESVETGPAAFRPVLLQMQHCSILLFKNG